MKKKIIKFIIPILCLLALILFFPIPMGSYDDGGTREYPSLTYKIVVWNRMIAYEPYRGDELRNDSQQMDPPVYGVYHKTSIFWFSKAKKSISELWILEQEDHRIEDYMKSEE